MWWPDIQSGFHRSPRQQDTSFDFSSRSQFGNYSVCVGVRVHVDHLAVEFKSSSTEQDILFVFGWWKDHHVQQILLHLGMIDRSSTVSVSKLFLANRLALLNGHECHDSIGRHDFVIICPEPLLLPSVRICTAVRGRQLEATPGTVLGQILDRDALLSRMTKGTPRFWKVTAATKPFRFYIPDIFVDVCHASGDLINQDQTVKMEDYPLQVVVRDRDKGQEGSLPSLSNWRFDDTVRNKLGGNIS